MYMNLKPNQHKRISYNTTTMTSLGFIGPPLNLAPTPIPNLIFCSGPPNYFGLKFLGPPPPLNMEGGGTMNIGKVVCFWLNLGPNFINIWRAQKKVNYIYWLVWS